MSHDSGVRRFVHALLVGGVGVRRSETYLVDGRSEAAPASVVAELISSGALDGDGRSCRANAQTRGWLRRAHLGAEGFGQQHRRLTEGADGRQINLLESPLARLAAASGTSEAFLASHHVEAGERVRRLVERAQLQPRLTMTYAASRPAGANQNSAAEISELAADARRDLASIYRLLPPDCAGVVVDVCGLLKGLQQVERERGWPRRSAKLVLRIGLEQLAQQFGVTPFARGLQQTATRGWLGEGAKPLRFE
jgi:hypothetical protein